MTTTFSAFPKSKSKFISLVRQYIANAYSGQKLYVSLVNMDSVTSASAFEHLVYTNATESERNEFFNLVLNSNAVQSMNDSIFKFSKKNDPEWYQQVEDTIR